MLRSIVLCRLFCGLFGQDFSFNANVEFSKIGTSNESFMTCIMKKAFQKQILQYCMIQIDVFRIMFEFYGMQKSWCKVPKGERSEGAAQLSRAYFIFILVVIVVVVVVANDIILNIINN